MANPPGEFIESGPATVVAAADSGRASRIPANARFVTVSANTNDTSDWVVLPTGILPGHTIRGYSVVGHVIRTEAASNVKINDVDSDGSQSAAITATWNWIAEYMGTTGWIVRTYTKLGAAGSALVPA